MGNINLSGISNQAVVKWQLADAVFNTKATRKQNIGAQGDEGLEVSDTESLQISVKQKK